MASPALVATFTTRTDIGKSDPETGRVFPPLILTNDVILPTTIDRSFTTEVTAAIQAFIDAQPDGTRLLLQPASHYYCDDQLNWAGKKYFKLDGNGSTIQSKKKFPFIQHYTGITILAPGDKGIWASQPPASGPITVGPSEQLIYVQPGHVPTLAGVSNDGCSDDPIAPTQDNIPTQSKIGQALKPTGYRAAVIGSNVQPPDGPVVPGTNLSVLFLGDQNTGIARLSFDTDDAGVRCQHIKVCNIVLAGTNTAGVYEKQVEGQHAIDCKGVDGIEIGPGVICRNVWGDGINLALDNPPGPGTILDPRPNGLAGGNACRNVYVHDTEIHHNGRQGISPTGIIGLLVERDVTIHNYPRTGIDIEVTENGVARDITLRCQILGGNFISIASYPVKTNTNIDNVVLDAVITRVGAVTINNPSPATRRWTNIQFRNVDASLGAGVPFGQDDGVHGFVVKVLGVDGFLAVGCTQSMQFPRTRVMFYVDAAQSRSVDVHDNLLTCGPAWVAHHAYALNDCVTDGTNAWRCRSAHNSGNAGSAGSQPSVGATSATFWQSLQVIIDSFPVLSARFVTETDLAAALNAVAPPPAKLTAAFSTETDLGVRMRTVRRLHATFSTETDLAGVVTDVNPPAVLTARFSTETRVAARVHSPRRGVPENEFRVGSGALTGPGWDEEPDGWDSTAFGGTG